MSRRPLRQFYGHDRPFALDGVTPLLAPFRRHRARFLGALASLTEDQWVATTRCDAWNAKEVAFHIASADAFWALTIERRAEAESTTYLVGFDATTSPDAFIAAQRDLPAQDALAALTTSTANLDAVLARVGDDDWSMASESPVGHMPVSSIAAHSLWDTWVHERDVLIPLDHTPPVEEDELLNATAYTLFLGGVQGGVLDDPDAVGDGPDEAFEATVRFEELTSALRVRVDRGVVVEAVGADDGAVDCGSAVEFVEGFCGRVPIDPVAARLPSALAAQLDRARQIL